MQFVSRCRAFARIPAPRTAASIITSAVNTGAKPATVGQVSRSLSSLSTSSQWRNVSSISSSLVPSSSSSSSSSQTRGLASAATGREKLLLLYSGGLDTSVILHWLIEQGYDVVCYMANLGQDEDFEYAQEKAKKIGALDCIVGDLRQTFVEDYIVPAAQANALYEGRYLMGTSLARPCISKGAMQAAVDHGCTSLGHGATGKGNDQVSH